MPDNSLLVVLQTILAAGTNTAQPIAGKGLVNNTASAQWVSPHCIELPASLPGGLLPGKNAALGFLL